MVENLKKYIKLGFDEQILLIEAILLLIIAQFLIKILPNTKLLSLIKNNNPCSFEQYSRLEKIKLAISRAKICLFRLPKCYPQAIAATWMLKRRKIRSQLFLGVAKDENGQLLAHAWSKSADFYLTGEQNRQQFNIIYTT